MNNTSLEASGEFLNEETMYYMWIICESISICLISACFYLLVVISSAVTASTRRNSKQTTNHSVGGNATSVASETKVTETSTSHQTPKNHKRENTAAQTPTPRDQQGESQNLLLKAIIVCLIFATARGAIEQYLLLKGSASSYSCNIFSKLMISFTALTLHVGHVFLWMRQWTFYKSPLLRSMRTKKLKALSLSAYWMMPVMLVVALSLHLAWREYKVINGQCKGDNNFRYTQYVPFGVLLSFTVTIQITLSSLFLYPLVKHRTKQKSFQTTRKVTNMDTGKSPDKILACIKRVLKGATVGITTDVLGALAGMFFLTDMPMFMLSVIYNCNLTLNIICNIYTFAEWKRMISPFKLFYGCIARASC